MFNKVLERILSFIWDVFSFIVTNNKVFWQHDEDLINNFAL